MRSPPSWRRGLKFRATCGAADAGVVASLVEAWIEISPPWRASPDTTVASLVEAWIEMIPEYAGYELIWSPPSWREGGADVFLDG